MKRKPRAPSKKGLKTIEPESAVQSLEPIAHIDSMPLEDSIVELTSGCSTSNRANLSKREQEKIWTSYIERAETNRLDESSPGEGSEITVASLLSPPEMRACDIAALIETLAQSYKCSANNISYSFDPIIVDGQLSIDSLKLIFVLETIVDYELIQRPIHTMTISIPLEVRQLARGLNEHFNVGM